MKLFAVLVLLLVGVAHAEDSNYYFRGKQYSIEYTLKEERQEIRLQGNLFSGVVEDLSGLKKVQKLLRHNVDVRVIVESEGGYIKLFEDLSRSIRKACSGACLITTIVPDGGRCASACVPFFMTGYVRKAGPYSMFGFHQAAVLPGSLKLSGMAESDLRKSGVDEYWLNANKHLFESLEMKWLTPDKLRDSNIVTQITD